MPATTNSSGPLGRRTLLLAGAARARADTPLELPALLSQISGGNPKFCKGMPSPQPSRSPWFHARIHVCCAEALNLGSALTLLSGRGCGGKKTAGILHHEYGVDSSGGLGLRDGPLTAVWKPAQCWHAAG